MLVTVAIPAVVTNRAPFFTQVSPVSVVTGATASLSLVATDPDGDAITISVSSLGGIPAGTSQFTDNGDGTASFTWPTTASDAGTFTPAFAVSDNTETGLLSVSITVAAPTDTTPPAVTFQLPLPNSLLATSQPTVTASVTDNGGPLNASQILFKFDGTEETGFTLAANGSLTFTPSAPIADGAHTVFLRATDAAQLSTSASIAFSTKTQVQSIVLAATPALTAASSIDLGGTTEPGLMLELLVGGQPEGSATAGAQGAFLFSGVPLSPGIQTLVVTGTDAAGNSATPVSRSITRDSTPPAISITGPTGLVATTAPTVSVDISDSGAGVDPASILLKLDDVAISGVTFSGGQATVTLAGVSQGSHQLSATAADLLGTQAATVTESFAVDTVGPTAIHPFLDAATIEEISNSTPLISVAVGDPSPGSGLDAGSIVLSIDGTTVAHEFLALAGEVRFDAATLAVALADGTHTLALQIADLAGNSESFSGSFVVNTNVVDDDPPFVSNPIPSPNSVSNDSGASSGIAARVVAADEIGFVFSDLDAGPDFSSLQIEVNGNGVTSGAAAFRVSSTQRIAIPFSSVSADLVEGVNTIVVDGADLNGLRGGLTWQFFIDRTPPEAPTTTALPGYVNAVELAVPVDVGGDQVTGDSTVTVRVLVNGVMVSERQGQLDSQVILPGVTLAAGENVVQAQVVDVAGNESLLSDPRNVRLDIEPPQVSNFRNTSGALSGTQRPTFAARIRDILSGPDPSSIELFLNSALTSVDVRFDSGTGDLEILTLDDLANGTYEAGLLVRDIAGNETLTTTTFAIEHIELVAPSDVELQPATSELLLRLEGAKPPDTGVEVLLDEVVVATTSVSAATIFEIRQTVPTLPVRSQVSVRSYDAAGNRSEDAVLGQLVSDSAPPRVLQRFPTEALVSLDDAVIDVVLADTVSGIDRSTLSLTVGGTEVTPVVTGPDSALRLRFSDRALFEALPAGAQVEVSLIADDLSQPANRLALNWSFIVVSNAAPAWAPLPRYVMREDGQLEIDLANLVGDLDHETAILQLTAITTNTELGISLAGQVVTFTPAANYHEFGIAIELEARDPVGATALETLFLDVAPVNDVPRFVTRPDTLEVIPGETLQQIFVAEDPDVLTDGDVLRYALAFGPSEASIDPASGLFVFATPQAAVATSAQLTVTDLEAASDTIQVVLQPSVTVGVEDDTLPLEFALFSAYPNPFSATTRLPFDLPEVTQVDITVYDALGRQVAVLASGPMEAGRHEATWDGAQMASGLYLYRIVAGRFVETGRLMLVR